MATPLPTLLGLISLGFLASSSSALLLPVSQSHAAFRPAACGPHRAPMAAFAMAAETVEAAEDALTKATATEAKAVSELADAIAADDDVVGCIVDAENADVRLPRHNTKPGLCGARMVSLSRDCPACRKWTRASIRELSSRWTRGRMTVGTMCAGR